MAVAIPLYAAKGSISHVLFMTLLNGLAEPIGVLIGAALLGPLLTPTVLSKCLAAVGGIMCCISLHELLPTAIRYAGQAKASLALFGGMAVVFLALETVNEYFGHAHSHNHGGGNGGHGHSHGDVGAGVGHGHEHHGHSHSHSHGSGGMGHGGHGPVQGSGFHKDIPEAVPNMKAQGQKQNHQQPHNDNSQKDKKKDGKDPVRFEWGPGSGFEATTGKTGSNKGGKKQQPQQQYHHYGNGHSHGHGGEAGHSHSH
jgi:hypothetical protein